MGDIYLAGKTINEIKIADDKKAILFRCDDGDHIAKADGDCCSETWIESISAPAGGFPCVVLGGEELMLADDEREGEWGDVTQFYGFKIDTSKGEILIDYRNSSNGYYGGDLSWPDDGYFYGGVYGQNVSSENWVDPEFS